MDEQAFLGEMAQILEMDIEDVTPDLVLDQQPIWDSLAVVSTIVAIDQLANVKLDAKALVNCVTIGDVLAVVAERQV